MDRLEILRGSIDVASGQGLEIGPLTSPIVPRELGSVCYVDHATTEELREKYRADPAVNENNIVDVDFVWGSQALAEAVGDKAPFDYVVASHVLEHVPDLIGWLAEIRSILRPGGRVSLCMPDRRYSFDVRRRNTDISEVVEAYLLRLRRPAPRATFDHFYRHVDVDTGALWRGEAGHDNPPPKFDDAMSLTRLSVEDEKYVDTHCWVFSDQVFVDLMGELMRLGFIDLRFVSFTPTRVGEFEFFATLERPAEGESDDERLRRNLASLPRSERREPAPDRSQSAPLSTGHTEQPCKSLMVVSERERRLLERKRSTLARIRSVASKRPTRQGR